MDPITRVVIRHEKIATGYSELIAKIDTSGELVLDGCDAGASVEDETGDWDYEYWITVPALFKDTILLHLIKDHFNSVHEMKTWLESLGIPCNFTSY